MNNVALVAEGENCATHEFSIHTALCTVNRLLAGRRASVDFKKPWDSVFEFKEKVKTDRGDLVTKNLLGKEIFAQNAFFLPLLDKIRTFFKENPDAEI